MDRLLKKNIIEKILSEIPSYLNPVDYLQELLGISKESVYRRIKGNIPFTLNELAILSSHLHFSIDEIIFAEKNNPRNKKPVLFQFESNILLDSEKTFIKLLQAQIEGNEKIRAAKNVEVLVATNRFMLLTAINYDHLFKFYYYKWIHQTQQKHLDFSISDVIVSDEILFLKDKLKSYQSVGKHTYILDANFLKNMLLDIRYYYSRKLITEKELGLLQKDFFSFLDAMEHKIKNNRKEQNYSNQLYISSTKIDSNGLYYKYNNKESLSLWISFGTNINTKNPEVCRIYTNWFHSLKKYSSLITGCNEALQIEFLDKQRRLVEMIADNHYNYG